MVLLLLFILEKSLAEIADPNEKNVNHIHNAFKQKTQLKNKKSVQTKTKQRKAEREKTKSEKSINRQIEFNITELIVLH